jgi:hypothetical protein
MKYLNKVEGIELGIVFNDGMRVRLHIDMLMRLF